LGCTRWLIDLSEDTAASIENRWLSFDLASMVSPSTTPASERARIEERLALIDLLIALSEESVAGQRLLAEQSGFKGEALAEALTKLTVIESLSEHRKAERKRLLESLLGVDARKPSPPVTAHPQGLKR
jgi:hypothetical protein